MTRKQQLCKACARPLKEKAKVGPPSVGIYTVHVCKSPICKLYNRAQ